jgi:hypothetical protein
MIFPISGTLERKIFRHCFVLGKSRNYRGYCQPSAPAGLNRIQTGLCCRQVAAQSAGLLTLLAAQWQQRNAKRLPSVVMFVRVSHKPQHVQTCCARQQNPFVFSTTFVCNIFHSQQPVIQLHSRCSQKSMQVFKPSVYFLYEFHYTLIVLTNVS